MKSLKEILAVIVTKDPALRGLDSEALPEAAKARIQNSLCSFENQFLHEELETLKDWTGGDDIFSRAEKRCDEKPDGSGCSYYVFSDRSLYFSSTGDSEVWSFASDFADQKIVNGYDGKLDRMDLELLEFLGGFTETIVDRNGVKF